MNLTMIDKILWAAGFLLNAALLFVLLYKRRYRKVPFFTAWISFQAVYTVILFIAYRFGTKQIYAQAYWSGAFFDLLMQLAVVVEIARSVMIRSGRLVEGARLPLMLGPCIGPIVAGLLAWTMTPASQTRLDAIDARANLFTTVLISLLLTTVILVSQHLGLGLRTHIMRETYGLILWSLVSFCTDTLHAYWRTLGHFTLLENIRIAFFQLALIYWSISFWRSEEDRHYVTKEVIEMLETVGVRLQSLQSRSGISDKSGESLK